jgi:hypothetical protein
MRRSLAFVFFVAVSSTALGCKEDESRPPAASDLGGATAGGAGGGGGAGDGGGADGGGDAGDAATAPCNTLTNDANVVDQNRLAGEPVTGNGGTITPGTYELKTAEVYVGTAAPGPSGVTYQGVLRVTGSKIERVTKVQANQGSTPVETRSIGDFTAAGTTLTVTQTCPAPFQDQYTYTVTTANNTLNITSLITKESFTFTLR